MKCKLFILFSFLYIILCSIWFFLSLFPCNYYNYILDRLYINKIDNNLSSLNSSFSPQFLTHKMVMYDLEHGITSEQIANKALNNINYYFAQISNNCILEGEQTSSDIINYISCANKTLGEYFYYQPSQETSNNYANQRSDCDLNTYLLIDAMKKVGIDAYIIYAPNHAFLGAKSKNQEIILWETTIDKNKGEKIDTQIITDANKIIVDSLSSFYKKNDRIPYYRYYNTKYAFDLYKILVSDISNVDSLALVEGSYLNDTENAIIENAYFELRLQKNKFTDSDLEKLKKSLQKDINNENNRVLLATFYENHKMLDQAREHIEILLKSERCGKDCIELAIRLDSEGNSYFLQKYVQFHDSKLVTKVKQFFKLDKMEYTYKDYKNTRLKILYLLTGSNINKFVYFPTVIL